MPQIRGPYERQSVEALVEALVLAHSDSVTNYSRRDEAKAALLAAIAELEAEVDSLSDHLHASVEAHAAERERCAKVCDALSDIEHRWVDGSYVTTGEQQAVDEACWRCAAAIRGTQAPSSGSSE